MKANLVKCSTLKFMTNEFCAFNLHSQIHRLHFHREKSRLVDFFPRKIYFSAIFDFHFRDCCKVKFIEFFLIELDFEKQTLMKQNLSTNMHES